MGTTPSSRTVKVKVMLKRQVNQPGTRKWFMWQLNIYSEKLLLDDGFCWIVELLNYKRGRCPPCFLRLKFTIHLSRLSRSQHLWCYVLSAMLLLRVFPGDHLTIWSSHHLTSSPASFYNWIVRVFSPRNCCWISPPGNSRLTVALQCPGRHLFSATFTYSIICKTRHSRVGLVDAVKSLQHWSWVIGWHADDAPISLSESTTWPTWKIWPGSQKWGVRFWLFWGCGPQIGWIHLGELGQGSNINYAPDSSHCWQPTLFDIQLMKSC